MSVVTGEASSKAPTTRPNPEPPSIISPGVASSLALTSAIASAIRPVPPSITAFNASIEVIAFIIVVKSVSTALVSSIFENTRFCEFVVSALNSFNPPCISCTETPKYPAISYARPVISPEVEPFINPRTSSLCDALIAVNSVLASVKFSSVMSLPEPPALTSVSAVGAPGIDGRSSTFASRTLTAESKSSPVESSEVTVT